GACADPRSAECELCPAQFILQTAISLTISTPKIVTSEGQCRAAYRRWSGLRCSMWHEKTHGAVKNDSASAIDIFLREINLLLAAMNITT
ncbi:MAG: hypothetical protein K2X78_02660, partial [Burkholderiaceae bacterium]|nr:hypothetical protein [Burkholderiaceae bacterium]